MILDFISHRHCNAIFRGYTKAFQQKVMESKFSLSWHTTKSNNEKKDCDTRMNGHHKNENRKFPVGFSLFFIQDNEKSSDVSFCTLDH